MEAPYKRAKHSSDGLGGGDDFVSLNGNSHETKYGYEFFRSVWQQRDSLRAGSRA